MSRRSSDQEPRGIAYLGPPGTYTELAARKFFSNKARLVPFDSIADVFLGVKENRVLQGVVPLENSTEGAVNDTLDLLYRTRVMMCGEAEERIDHNLLARPTETLREIKYVFSHQQAIAQCKDFLRKKLPDASVRETFSTADAASKARRFRHAAAIGSRYSAKIYGMKILARNVNDIVDNFTRFAVIAESDAKPTGRDKTSIVFATRNIPGALFKALEPFTTGNINLTKIESRPTREKPWEYIFFMDFEGHKSDQVCRNALSELENMCNFFRIIGSYPRAKTGKT